MGTDGALKRLHGPMKLFGMHDAVSGTLFPSPGGTPEYRERELGICHRVRRATTKTREKEARLRFATGLRGCVSTSGTLSGSFQQIRQLLQGGGPAHVVALHAFNIRKAFMNQSDFGAARVGLELKSQVGLMLLVFPHP